MKKILFFVLAVVLVTIVVLTSCSKKEENLISGDKTRVTFKLTTKAMQSRAGKRHYILEVYAPAKDGVYSAPILRLEQDNETFVVDLEKSTDYICLFWGDSSEKGDSDGVYNTSNLMDVTLNPQKNATDDAFFARLDINTSASADKKLDISLIRAIAQIDLVEIDKIETDLPISASILAYEKFNVMTAMAFGTLKEFTHEFMSTVTIGKFASIQTFASVSEMTTDLSITYGSNPVNKITDVPLKSNYITKVSGKFGTSEIGISEDFKFDIKLGGWDNQGINVSPKILSIPVGGGTFSLAVSTNIDFNVKINTEWITEMPTEAILGQNMMFSVEANTLHTKRVGEILFESDYKTETITITQERNSSDVTGKIEWLTDGDVETTFTNNGGMIELMITPDNPLVQEFLLTSSFLEKSIDPVSLTVYSSDSPNPPNKEDWKLVHTFEDINFCARFYAVSLLLTNVMNLPNIKLEIRSAEGTALALNEVEVRGELSDWDKLWLNFDFTDIPITFQDDSPLGRDGSKYWDEVIQDDEEYFAAKIMEVIKELYYSPEDFWNRRANVKNGFSAFLDEYDFAAGVWGGPNGGCIGFSIGWVEDLRRGYLNPTEDYFFKRHLRGVFHHELTHMYTPPPRIPQTWKDADYNGGAVEGIADGVHMVLGQHTMEKGRQTVGGHYDSGYGDTGYFLNYLKETYDQNAIRRFNATQYDLAVWTWNKALVYTLNDPNADVDVLWEEYQQSLRDRGYPTRSHNVTVHPNRPADPNIIE